MLQVDIISVVLTKKVRDNDILIKFSLYFQSKLCSYGTDFTISLFFSLGFPMLKKMLHVLVFTLSSFHVITSLFGLCSFCRHGSQMLAMYLNLKMILSYLLLLLRFFYLDGFSLPACKS